MWFLSFLRCAGDSPASSFLLNVVGRKAPIGNLLGICTGIGEQKTHVVRYFDSCSSARCAVSKSAAPARSPFVRGFFGNPPAGNRSILSRRDAVCRCTILPTLARFRADL